MQSAPALPVSTGWIRLRVTGPVDVASTFRGYAPVLPVVAEHNGLPYILYIGAKSLMNPLERLRQSNGGTFSGIEMSIRKSSSDRLSSYEVRDRNGNIVPT